MQPDLAQARAFLAALDEGSESWSFQTFADGEKRPDLIRQLHGSLDEHWPALVRLNERGAGVFVTVNETDGQGRRKANIRRIRALFADLDGAPIEPLQQASAAPHIVVESSPGRYHAYWRVLDCEPGNCELALRALIARYAADPACCDRSRVLRLPGFWHQKRAPFMVRTVSTLPGEYRLADFELPSGPLPTEDAEETEVTSSSSDSSVGGAIRCFLPKVAGERNRCLFALARYLRGLMPDATREELRPIIEQWHCLALPVIQTASLTTSWGDFVRGWQAVRIPHGAILDSILRKIDMANEIPASIAALGYDERDYRLVRICEELQRHEGEEPFFLAARKAGELVGVHFTDASKMLAAFVADGVLELVKRGAGKAASRYRYIWPEEVATDGARTLAGADQGRNN